jgi:hypothetical protein
VFDSIIDPTLGPDLGPEDDWTTLAARPDSLAGLRVGLLANTKRNADVFLEEVAALLVDQYGAQVSVVTKKPSIVLPVSGDMVEWMRAECDVVVVGVGDCGSCSASAVADGILLEQAGIPAVVICSDAFTVSADAMATLRGAPGYSYITTPHPVANLTRPGVRARAIAALPQIIATLTAPALATRA